MRLAKTIKGTFEEFVSIRAKPDTRRYACELVPEADRIRSIKLAFMWDAALNSLGMVKWLDAQQQIN